MKHGMMHKLLIALLVISGVFACFSPALAADDQSIVGGSRIGPVSLGQPVSKYEAFLGAGQPISQTFINYESRGMALLIKNGVISGILVYDAKYKTPEGIRVGDSLSKLTKTYGNYLKTDAGSLAYSDLGLAFNQKDGKISRIMVVQATPDALLGDKMIVPNSRVGKIKIGNDISSVTGVWGQPDEQKELEGNKSIKVYKYKNKAVKVLVKDSMIVGVQVNSYKYRTPEGITVNSPLSAVLKTYGKGYKKVEDSYMYGKLGLGFYIHKNKVLEILLTYRKE